MNPPQHGMIAALFFISSLFSSSATVDHLTRGSSLAVEQHDTDFLVSENNTFACGFYEVGDNAFAFAVWFKNSADRTTAWVANRDHPVNGRGSRISLHKDGRLVLTDFDGTVVWSSNTSTGAVDRVKLFDSGNLAVIAGDGRRLWQSFDSPTDTLLPLQPITRSRPLVSSSSPGSVSSGLYRFYFDNDNILRLIYDGPEITSIYWPDSRYDVWANERTTYNNTRIGVLDELGYFYASDTLNFYASDYGRGVTRRLTLDFDGNLRLYSLDKQQGNWSVTWQALQHPCDSIHGTCGLNGICVYGSGGAPKVGCSCPPSFEVVDPTDWRKGCRRKYKFSCRPRENHFLALPYTDFWGYDLNYSERYSFAACKQMCQKDCSCQAFAYKQLGSGECYPKNILFNGRTYPDAETTLYIKLPKSVLLSQFSVASSSQPPICNDTAVQNVGSPPEYYQRSRGKAKWVYLYGFASALFAIEVLFISCGWWFIFRREKMPLAAEEGYKVISSQFRRYTYAELKKATKNFKDVLGRGGSGAVYKGIEDHRVMAVKKLEDVMQGEEEFQAELSLIGRIYHKNLVRIFGYCSENSHRLLVSEFIEKGSLDKYLFDDDTSATLLGWSESALSGYVIHCDVKPENILLDRDFEPKIADFGLAKLFNRGGGGSNLSRIRGTRGYIAPEWASCLQINGKVDVYSYGVVLLELVKGERVSNWVVDGVEEVGLVLRRSIKALKEKMETGEEGWIGEFVDHRLGERLSWKQALLMLRIAFSCLEEDRNRRPTMESVVRMLLLGNDETSLEESNN
ncbi:receptor protein kinase ZmPK1 [Canna indica]|uniref:Receptor-like serine/threonine-protein kinase n=1 Tax=Canna indica TaxID=4628 RepID=A0AAQ3Q9T8_9LILI|nr:receptor protein kinase ZmPK1 [Canna indica]